MSDQQPPAPVPAFRQLQQFIASETARKPRKRTNGPKPETANVLTRRIVKHIRANGGFATRLASTGSYRADLQKFVASQQVPGMPDVFACVNGDYVGIEVKVGNDTTSEVQRNTIADLEKSGAGVFVAHDFDSFKDWFTANFLTPPVRQTLTHFDKLKRA